MIKGVAIEGFSSFPGIRWGLKDPTTELLLRIEGDPRADALRRYRDWFDRRYAGVFLLSEGRFPDDWLVDSAADPLAVHLAAGITALQRLGMQPVRRAQVLERDGEWIRLALPGFNGTVLQAAVRLAIQLLLELDADPQGGGERLRNLEEELDLFISNAPDISRSGEETLRFALAADRLGIPVVSTLTGYLEIGHGCGRRVLSNSLLNTWGPPSTLAGDKMASYLVLHRAGIPVPATRIVNTPADLAAAAEALGWPLVVKPLDGSLQRGVTTDVADRISLEAAFLVARNVSQGSVLLQQQVEGLEFRLTAIGPSFRAARLKTHASVTGDGRRSVAELIEICNQDPLRGDHAGAVCARIRLGDELEGLLRQQQLTLGSVPESGRTVRLSQATGRLAGGRTTDAMEQLHPSYFDLLARVARVLQLDVVGLDLITANPSLPWWEAGARVLEANSRPGLKTHDHACPGLRIHQEHLRHGLSGSEPPWLVAIAAGDGLGAATQQLEDALTAHLPAGTLLGVLRQGECSLGGELLPLDPTARGQVGQALLADPLCGAALMAWQAEPLRSFGRPCERLDLAVLAAGADPVVVQEILAAEPQLVIGLGEGVEAFRPALEAWLSREGGTGRLELLSAEQLPQRLPELLRSIDRSLPGSGAR